MFIKLEKLLKKKEKMYILIKSSITHKIFDIWNST